VVGINTAIASRNGGYMGVGFSIPSTMVTQVTRSIIDSGQVERGWLGAAIQNVTEDLAASFNYGESDGVLIADVMPDSPAETAGLKSGDIVVKFNGKRMASASQLRNEVASASPGAPAELNVFRAGDWITLSVTLGKLDDSKLSFGGSPSDALDDFGISIQDTTPELRQRLNLNSNTKGVVVVDVKQGSISARAGIQPGDLIVSINGEDVSNVGQVHDAVSSTGKNGTRLLIERDGYRRFVVLRQR
ncbi:MAG: PDZ domain-containing protein, partial [Planctomycetales bacterium]|nr:PDZ domain-containing protein [Planctomycetales bacterium]